MTIKIDLHHPWKTNLNKSRSQLGPAMLALLAYLVLEAHLQMFQTKVTSQKYLETKAIQERLKQTSVGISVVRQSVLLDTSLQTEKTIE